MAVDLTQQPSASLTDGEGFAGATVIHGVAGVGASSVIHTASLVEVSSACRYSSRSPETRHTERGYCRSSTERVTGGALVTVERVRVGEKHCRHEAELIDPGGMPSLLKYVAPELGWR